MAVTAADDRFPPLLGQFENPIVLLARPHPVYLQSVNRPTVTGEQIRDGNRLCSRCPRHQRVVQDDQATASRKDLKQLIVPFAPGSGLNLYVRFLRSTLRQMKDSQMKQVPFEPE